METRISPTTHPSLRKSVLIMSSGSGPADKRSPFETTFLQFFFKLTLSFLVCDYDNEPTKAVLCEVSHE